MHEKSPALHCKYCGKSFFSKSHLIVLRSHNGERPFKCIHCKKTFLSGVASEMDIKVTLRKERFTTIFAMKSR